MVVYLDTDGCVISAEEFWRLVEHITMEGDQLTVERGVGRDVTLATQAPAAAFPGPAADRGFAGWRPGHKALG